MNTGGISCGLVSTVICFAWITCKNGWLKLFCWQCLYEVHCKRNTIFLQEAIWCSLKASQRIQGVDVSLQISQRLYMLWDLQNHIRSTWLALGSTRLWKGRPDAAVNLYISVQVKFHLSIFTQRSLTAIVTLTDMLLINKRLINKMCWARNAGLFGKHFVISLLGNSSGSSATRDEVSAGVHFYLN